MPLSDEDAAALRADLVRLQREKGAVPRQSAEPPPHCPLKDVPNNLSFRSLSNFVSAANREHETKLERLRKERLLGTSFNGQCGGGSADCRGTAATTMGSMWTRGLSAGGGSGQGLSYVPRGTSPKFPVECPPYVYIAWERRFEVFIINQGLGHTISPDAPQIAVISCVDDAYLVTEHRRVWGYICEATAAAPFENRLYECYSVSDALRAMREWALPLYPAERHLLVAELEGVQFMGDEDPKFVFARISRLETTMRAVGIKKNESDIVQTILRQLPERYDNVKITTLADPQLTRSRLENTIRSAYAQRKDHEIAKQWPAVGAPAEPPNPHALVVGRGFRDGGAVGGEGQRRDGGMVSRGGGMLRQQQQLQQHWSRGGGMLRQQQQQQQQHWSRDGGMPRQKQQQQHWSRGGGMARQQQQQQQWSHGGEIPHQHQRSSHAFPSARQARQQQPLQQPSRGTPTIGGDGEDGSSPLSETFFGGDGGAVEEWLQSDNMEMPMFSLSEGPQQSAPTAVALAATAPEAEAVTGTSVLPAVSSKGVAETHTSSIGAASTAAPAAAPPTGGTVFPTASVAEAARAPSSADEAAVLTAASATSDTVLSAAPIRGAVGVRESSAGTVSSNAAAEAAPSTGDIAAPDDSVERAARSSRQQLGPLVKSAAREGRPPTPLIPLSCFHWRSAITTAAGCSMAVVVVVTIAAAAAAAAATTTPATTTYGGMQPVLEHCCDPLIRGNDAGGVRE